MKRIHVEGIREEPGRVRYSLCHACRERASKVVTYANSFSKVILTLCDPCSEKDYFKLTSSGPSSWVVTEASRI